MSKNNNTAPVKQEENNQKKKLDASRIFLIVFAAIALVGILSSVIVAIALNKSKNVDYMKDNLSKYVVVSESLYNGISVKIDLPAVSDRDIEERLVQILCKNKIIPDDVVAPIPNVTISAGDVANIYYRGYTLGENGEKNYFDGGCNFNSSISALEIGSGTFISGFEYNLIGKNQNDYATMTKIDSGLTQHGDVIMLTYSAYYADGTAALAKTAMIDLSDPNLDETWGEGFSDYFNNVKGKTIGTKFATGSTNDEKLTVVSPKAGASDAEKDVFFDMTVTSAFRISDGNKLVVEAYFPNDYNEASLAGKTAFFEVYIKTVKDYDVPTIDEKFITETLKLTADELSSFAGNSIEEKYRSYVKAELDKEYAEDVRIEIEKFFWANLLEKSDFKKLPESEVKIYYDGYIDEINYTYSSGYSNYYSSIDEFARAYLQLGSKDDWKATLRTNAETAVKQKLVFYSVARNGGFIPTDAEYETYYAKVFDEHLKSYLEEANISETDTEKVEQAKLTLESGYDETYWYENVLYDFVIDKVIELANITYA